MRMILKDENLILVPENDEETRASADWKEGRVGHVLWFGTDQGTGLRLKDLGRKEDACNEPINVSSLSSDESVRLIGNFAATPFVLDGRRYCSVESFWQGLKFDEGRERRQVAEAEGPAARRLGESKGYGPTVVYEGREVVVGTRGHWDLMALACRAKFTQNADARAAPLATGDRPLTHKMRRDSRAIPGAIMAEIWMAIRQSLRGDERY